MWELKKPLMFWQNLQTTPPASKHVLYHNETPVVTFRKNLLMADSCCARAYQKEAGAKVWLWGQV